MPRTQPATLVEAVTALCGRLTAAGIRAVTDTRDLNPPAVLVIPPDMDWRFAAGTWAATWRVLCVVPSSGSDQDLISVAALIEAVRSALGYAPDHGTARTITIDGASDPLPAYELTWTD